MGRDKNYEQGQRDGAKNEYDPPHSMGPLTVLTTEKATLDRYQELNDAYDKGWSNGYKQR